VHHLDSWIKRDQLDVTCFLISLFNAQRVSDVNTSILRSLRLICWVISWVVLLWFDACWCNVVVWLGWCGIRMQAEASDIKLVSLYSTILVHILHKLRDAFFFLLNSPLTAPIIHPLLLTTLQFIQVSLVKISHLKAVFHDFKHKIIFVVFFMIFVLWIHSILQRFVVFKVDSHLLR